MDKVYNKESTYKEEPINENMGLSDIIDILNTLDNNSPGSNDILAASSVNDTNASKVMLMPSSGLSSPLAHNATNQSQSPGIEHKISEKIDKLEKPYIKIVEQPANKALRFRYECEGRSAGSIPGVNSTSEIKTFPVIEIANYKGEVTLVVSCVTKDPPYRPHPHNLVGKEGCAHGVYTVRIKGDPPRAVLNNLGVQCVRRKDIKAALELRESKNIDPFKTKFSHKDQPSSIDLNVVRLCFQAFIQTGPRQFKKLQPVVSEPVYDRKAVSNLAINRLCSCSAKVSGGDEIIMLCEKVTKEIKIKFYELNNEGYEIWHDYADFHHTDIHKNTAIAFKTPRYPNAADVTQKIQVYIQLERPSDGAISEPLPFEYYPDKGMHSFSKLHIGQLHRLQVNNIKSILSSNLFNCIQRDIIEYEDARTKINRPNDKSLKENTINNTINENNDEIEVCMDQLTVNRIVKLLKNDNNRKNKDSENNNIFNDNENSFKIVNSITQATSYENITDNDSFNETLSNASLQIAFKNPIDIPDKSLPKKEMISTLDLYPQSSNANMSMSCIKDSLLLPQHVVSKYNAVNNDKGEPLCESYKCDHRPSKELPHSVKSSKKKCNFISYIISRLHIRKHVTSNSSKMLNFKNPNLSPNRKFNIKKMWSSRKKHYISKRSVKSLQLNFSTKNHRPEILLRSNPSLNTIKESVAHNLDKPEYLHIVLNSNTDFHINNIPLLDGQMELIGLADRESIKNLCQDTYGIVLDPSVNLNEAEYFALYTAIPDHLDNNLSMEMKQCELLTPEEVAKRLAILNNTFKRRTTK